MSRAAGTLITTNNATYYNPRFMPGYRGHCPTIQFDFGETYGNATHKYFRDYRSAVLSSSADPYCRGGNFPTYYTHDPTLVISNRTRTRDRWLHTPKYQLTNRDHDRKLELNLFDDLSQKHREHYADKTGTLKNVAHFDLPVSAEEQFKKNKPFLIMSMKHSDSVNLPKMDERAMRKPLIQRSALVSTSRDRMMRDAYFERR